MQGSDRSERTPGNIKGEIAQLSATEQNEMLAKLRESGLTIGQLKRNTGIARVIITRAQNVQKQARPPVAPTYRKRLFVG